MIPQPHSPTTRPHPRIPLYKILQLEPIHLLQCPTPLVRLDQMPLSTIALTLRLRRRRRGHTPRRRRCLCSSSLRRPGPGSRPRLFDAVPVARPEALAVCADGWIPCVELLEGDEVFGRDDGAIVVFDGLVVLGAVGVDAVLRGGGAGGFDSRCCSGGYAGLGGGCGGAGWLGGCDGFAWEAKVDFDAVGIAGLEAGAGCGEAGVLGGREEVGLVDT